jgi:hypothetical protein
VPSASPLGERIRIDWRLIDSAFPNDAWPSSHGQDDFRFVTSLAAGSLGFVATVGEAGTDRDCPVQIDSFALYSPDGEDWRVSRLPGRGRDYASSVAVGDTIAVVGSTQRPHCGGGRRTIRGSRGAIWTSGDGTRWMRQEFRRGTGIQAITAADTGYIALGWSADVVPVGDGFCHEPRSWTSSDGRRWAETELEMGFQCVGFLDVVPVGDGFVAVRNVEEGDASPSLWGPAIDVNDPSDGHVSAVTLGAPGLVAVNREMDAYGGPWADTLWTSRDGAEWELVADMEGAFVSDIAADNGLLVAVGHSPDRTPALWASTDGRDWSRLTNVPEPEPTGWGWTKVAVHDGTIVALTEEGTVLLGTYQP